MTPEKKLMNQIVKYRAGIIYKCVNVADYLQDKNLDFPVEDQSSFDKGYENALCDMRAGMQKL